MPTLSAIHQNQESRRTAPSAGRQLRATIDGPLLPSHYLGRDPSWDLEALKALAASRAFQGETAATVSRESRALEGRPGSQDWSFSTTKPRWPECRWRDSWPTERTPSKSTSGITSPGEQLG